MRTVRVYYISSADELLYFEIRCSWQAADAWVRRLHPKKYTRTDSQRSYRSYRTYNDRPDSLVEHVEIIHPEAPRAALEGARLVVLPSQRTETA